MYNIVSIVILCIHFFRSRIIREESALNLMSQVRPFRLECDRRAWRSMARSSPELRIKSNSTSKKFKAKPVPTNLFGTDIYDRMLEDEYYRSIQYAEFYLEIAYIRKSFTSINYDFQIVAEEGESCRVNEILLSTSING